MQRRSPSRPPPSPLPQADASGTTRSAERITLLDDSVERPTITNEVELEAARKQSERETHLPDVQEHHDGNRSSLLTMANARASSLPPSEAESSGRVTPLAPLPVLDLPPRLNTPLGRPALNPLEEIRERLALGDYTGALAQADGVPTGSPHYFEAITLATHCKAILLQMMRAKVGTYEHVPFTLVDRQQQRWLSLDHRAGYLLSLMDGNLSIQEVMDVSSMSELDVLRVIYDLMSQSVIALR